MAVHGRVPLNKPWLTQPFPSYPPILKYYVVSYSLLL